MEEGGTTRGRRFSPRETTTTSRSESFSQPGHDHRSRTNRVAPTPHISINDIRLDSIRSPPLFAFQKTFTAPVSADFLPNRAPLYPSLTASSAFLSIFFFFFSFLSFFLSRINSIRSISLSAVYAFPLMEAIVKVSMDRLLTAPLVITFD